MIGDMTRYDDINIVTFGPFSVSWWGTRQISRGKLLGKRWAAYRTCRSLILIWFSEMCNACEVELFVNVAALRQFPCTDTHEVQLLIAADSGVIVLRTHCEDQMAADDQTCHQVRQAQIPALLDPVLGPLPFHWIAALLIAILLDLWPFCFS